jgi:hypothetical protein
MMKKRSVAKSGIVKKGHKHRKDEPKALSVKKSEATARKAFYAMVAEVRKLAPPPRYDLPKFLKSLYCKGCELASSPDLLSVAMSEHAQLPPGTSANPAAILLSLAAPHVKSNTKSKYVNALTYAYMKNVKPGQLKKFLKENGHLNGCCERCATEYGRGAKRKKRNPFRT